MSAPVDRNGQAVGRRLAEALKRGDHEPVALVPYLVAGAPTKKAFAEIMLAAAREADVLEIGLPFSDPVADGPVIAAVGRAAIERGVCLAWLLDELRALDERPAAPLVLMTYLNPLFAVGLRAAIEGLSEVGFEGLIVPDLPLEESAALRDLCDAQGIALVQLMAPTTPLARIELLAEASRGFVYAATRTGITGTRTSIDEARDRLAFVRTVSDLPVAAGFGIRDASQLVSLAGAVDAAVVGTALVEAVERGADPVRFLQSLRPNSPRFPDPLSTTTSE